MSLSTITKVGVVILAAGDGKRMKTGIPKVMNLLRGKPLIEHVVQRAEEANFGSRPVVVVCANHVLVQDQLGERAEYAVQEKQLGTGHAVASAENLLKGKADHVVVLYGDMPFITGNSIRQLVEEHVKSGAVLTLMTVTAPDFDDWRAQFNDFGRVIRNGQGSVVDVREKKDATLVELAIREVNTSYFCFKADWLWSNLKLIQNNNAQGEYYLVDLVKIAFKQGEKVHAVSIDPKEAIGINTKEHLETAATV